MSKRIFTDLEPRHLGPVIAGLADPWLAAGESRLPGSRGHERGRPAPGPGHGLPFTDRVTVTLVYLRFQLPHGLLATLYGVHRSTITMADVFACAAAHGIIRRMDGTEVQVRRPKAKKPGRRAFVSGNEKMTTKKAAVFTSEAGRTVFAGVFRPRPDARPRPPSGPRTSPACSRGFPRSGSKSMPAPRPGKPPGQVKAPPGRPTKDVTPRRPPPARNSSTSTPRDAPASSTSDRAAAR
jgi:hypothetical protein